MAGKPFKPPKDERGPHMRVYCDLFDSNAYCCLSANDQRAYMSLLRQKGSTNNGDLSLPFSMAQKRGIKSKTTLAACLRALCAVGLIAVTRKGGHDAKSGEGLPTLYRLTDHPVLERPSKNLEACKATNDWRAVTTLAAGRHAIRMAEAAAALAAAEKKTKTPVQKLDGGSPESGRVTPKSSPENGQASPTPVQKLDRATPKKKAANPMPARVAA